MPNGDSPEFKKELPALLKFFSGISKYLEQFASERNLNISKYYHESPSWDFKFRHPKGGEGRLYVERIDDQNIIIHQNWWFDDIEKFSRSIKWSSSDPIKLKPESLLALLDQKLDEILDWELGDWDEVHPGYEREWKIWTKEDFERMLSVLPLPTKHRTSQFT
jgi:hypothetical protein